MSGPACFELPRISEEHRNIVRRELVVDVRVYGAIDGEDACLIIEEIWNSSAIKWHATIPVKLLAKLWDHFPAAMRDALDATVQTYVADRASAALRDVLARALLHELQRPPVLKP